MVMTISLWTVVYIQPMAMTYFSLWETSVCYIWYALMIFALVVAFAEFNEGVRLRCGRGRTVRVSCRNADGDGKMKPQEARTSGHDGRRVPGAY